MRAPSFSLVTRQYRQTAAVERLAFALELQLAGAELALLVDQERVDRPRLLGREKVIEAWHAVRQQQAFEHDPLEHLVRSGLHPPEVGQRRARLVRVADRAGLCEQRRARRDSLRPPAGG